jgi:hypothetical protein
MRRSFSDRLERARVQEPPLVSARGDLWGKFRPRTNDGVALCIVASDGSEEVPWEHVSVSTEKRCPTWEEMCWVKGLFFEEEEPVMQLHPPASEYVNYHPYCLHLWRPLEQLIPLPPSIAVGPRTAGGVSPARSRAVYLRELFAAADSERGSGR